MGSGTIDPATGVRSNAADLRRSRPRSVCLLACVCLLALAGSAPAAEPSKATDPRPLWEAYPLDPEREGKSAPRTRSGAEAADGASPRREAPRAQGEGAQPPDDRPAEEPPARRLSAPAQIILVLVVLALLAGLVVQLYARRRAQRPHPAAEGAAARSEGPVETEATPLATHAKERAAEDAAPASPAPEPPSEGASPASPTPEPPSEGASEPEDSPPTAPGRRFRVELVDGELYVEGRSADPRIEEFRGFVHSVVVEEGAEAAPDGRPVKYLVIDQAKPAVFWAGRSEVARLSTSAPKPGPGAAPAGSRANGGEES
jgi:hypothetical protein